MKTEKFQVIVHRYYEDDSGCQSWDGKFYSDVYAIDGDRMLVYDSGDWNTIGGFLWVNFTEMIPECGKQDKTMPKVELYEKELDYDR